MTITKCWHSCIMSSHDNDTICCRGNLLTMIKFSQAGFGFHHKSQRLRSPLVKIVKIMIVSVRFYNCHFDFHLLFFRRQTNWVSDTDVEKIGGSVQWVVMVGSFWAPPNCSRAHSLFFPIPSWVSGWCGDACAFFSTPPNCSQEMFTFPTCFSFFCQRVLMVASY